MSLNREERYVVLIPGAEGTSGGLTGPLDPQCRFFPFDPSQPSPMERGIVRDWPALCAHWKQVYQRDLGISRRQGDHPVLLLVPSAWTKADVEIATKFFFEECNVPGFATCPAPVAALFGVNCVTGIVVEIGYDCIEVTPVVDAVPLKTAARLSPVGMVDVARAFLSHPDTDAATRAIPESTLAAATDLWSASLPTHIVPSTTLGDTPIPASLRTAPVDALLVALWSTVVSAVDGSDAAARISLLDAVVVTGPGASRIAHVRERLELDLRLVFPITSTLGETQPREVRFRDTPEYLEGYAGKTAGLAGYLGASLLARLVFPDAKAYVSRDEYETHGPGYVHTKPYGGISV
ncbi:hypothetical protein H9P43_005650 [Blastocladiella emersonii ATCC 22665]|nr:hypothetical protein H9P43_005650 [Blastocladiella emersonii ATCC 22665]